MPLRFFSPGLYAAGPGDNVVLVFLIFVLDPIVKDEVFVDPCLSTLFL